jgi:8-oxo-dGTP pyrophosphatase MutT (NUDIX family)
MRNNLVKFIYKIFLSFVLVFHLAFAAGNSDILRAIPTEKGTVVVIPYTVVDGEVWVLLGRERIDSTDSSKAGCYCDFGGSIKPGSSLVNNAIRELDEETYELLKVSELALIERGTVLRKISATGRQIFYILYPLSESEIEAADSDQWNLLVKNNPLGKSSECIEKDEFMWIPLKLLVAPPTCVITVQNHKGTKREIKLRRFFWEDFCKHPGLLQFLERSYPGRS